MATPHVSGLAALYGYKRILAQHQQKCEMPFVRGAIDLAIRCWYNILHGLQMLQVLCTEKQDPVISLSMNWQAGSSASTSDEWIEIRNMRNVPTNVGAFELTENTGTGSINGQNSERNDSANGYFLVSNNAKNYVFQEENRCSMSIPMWWIPMSLSNTALQIKLYNGVLLREHSSTRREMGNATCGRKCRPQSNYESKNYSWRWNACGELVYEYDDWSHYDSGAIEKGTPKRSMSLILFRLM